MGARHNNQWGRGITTDGIAAKRTTGLWRNDQRGCGETTNGVAAKRTTGLWRNERRVCGETNDGFVAKRLTGAQYGWFLSMRMNCRNRYAVISISSPGIPHPRGFAGAQPRAISRNRSAVEFQPRAISRNRSAVEYCQSCWFYWRISIALVCLMNTNHVGCVGETGKTNRVGCISEAGYQPRSGCGE